MHRMRPAKDAYFLQMADLVSSRGTCSRRKVGAVLVNNLGHVMATGYNGVASGMQHCEGVNKCSGADSKSGTDLNKCEATHAEQNALLQCRDVQRIYKCYVTASPCIHCVKLLLNTTCFEIVFIEKYPCSEAEELWKKAGRQWTHFGKPNPITDTERR